MYATIKSNKNFISDKDKDLFCLSRGKINKLNRFCKLLAFYNSKANLISRKDSNNIYSHHVRHALVLELFSKLFTKSKNILDIGSGGGIPSIPFAICNPEKKIISCDISTKKTFLQREIINDLKVENITVECIDVKNISQPIDTIICRAFSSAKNILSVATSLSQKNNQKINKIILLKGGKIEPEIEYLVKTGSAKVFNLSEIFSEKYYESKTLISIHEYLSASTIPKKGK